MGVDALTTVAVQIDGYLAELNKTDRDGRQRADCFASDRDVFRRQFSQIYGTYSDDLQA